jgi:hypothetical protein
VLQSLQEELEALRGDRPLRVRVRGLQLMTGDPEAAHVLYAGIQDPCDPHLEPSVPKLMAMCRAVIRAFARSGLVPPQDVR